MRLAPPEPRSWKLASSCCSLTSAPNWARSGGRGPGGHGGPGRRVEFVPFSSGALSGGRGPGGHGGPGRRIEFVPFSSGAFSGGRGPGGHGGLGRHVEFVPFRLGCLQWL